MKDEALKERIKSIAKDKGVTFHEVWKHLLLERFLARLSKSKYKKKFIFKGGLLLAQFIEIGRETIDADFLIEKMKAELATIEIAIKEIIALPLEDGFTFSLSGIKELTQPHMDYPGLRINLDVNFGKMKDKIQLDAGIGDIVESMEYAYHALEYKNEAIFDDEEISLLVYPLETIFAEKLETIISKGSTNSRMKDYHDLFLITRSAELLDLKKLKSTIEKTFSHRETTLKLPISFSESELTGMQKLWANHLKNLGSKSKELDLPLELMIVLENLNSWLKKYAK